jgi:sugar lactone lactonase YvrE
MSLHLALGLASVVTAAIPVSDWAIGASDPFAGAGIVATQDGVVYFVDRARDVVWKLEDGALDSVVVGMKTSSLQLSPSGTLMGISRSRRGAEAWLVREDGRVQTLARGYGRGLAIDAEGQLYGWSEGPRGDRISVWRARSDGQRFELASGLPGHRDGTGGAVRLFPIGAMLVSGDGSVLVTSGPAVRRVTPDGRVSTVAAGSSLLKPKQSLWRRLAGVVRGHLSGIASDGNGALYVANAERELVARVARGKATSFYKSPRGWRPVGVAATRDRVYVLEYGRGVRVAFIDKQGHSRPLLELAATIS